MTRASFRSANPGDSRTPAAGIDGVRVAVVTSYPVEPARPHGGVEAVSVNLVRALAELPGVEVHVVTACGGEAWGGAARVECDAGVTVHRLPRGERRLLSYATGEGRRLLLRYLAGLAPDVVHAHDFYGLMVRGRGGARVFTVHGFIHEDTRYGGGDAAWLRARLWRWAELRAWADHPHIVSISPYVRERLRGIARGTIHDICNPIAADCFDVRPAPARPARIFSAAVLSPRKNTFRLLEAFRGVVAGGTDAELRLAGAAVDCGYEVRLRGYVDAHGLRERVRFLGALTAAEVRAELAEASVFALLSFEEGAPMGIAEAMAARVPVVASNRCGMPYMIRDGENGFLVDAVRPRTATAALALLLSDEAWRRRMGARARLAALRDYHPRRVAERTLRVYRLAMKDAGGML